MPKRTNKRKRQDRPLKIVKIEYDLETLFKKGVDKELLFDIDNRLTICNDLKFAIIQDHKTISTEDKEKIFDIFNKYINDKAD